MCEKHRFEFDVDRAYADQLIGVFEASPAHLLSRSEAPKEQGVYALYRAGIATPTYIGQARKLTARLQDHLKKIDGRRGISTAEITCRYLVINRSWEVSRAEEVLIKQYAPPWNGIPGFSMHVPGSGRPGKPGYVNQWDRQFPRLP